MPAPQIVDNVSELAALMKTVYGPRLENQQNLAAMIHKKFSKSTVEFGGNRYEFPVRLVNTQSVGSRPYRQSLPEPILNTDRTSSVRHKFFYGTLDIPGPDIEKGRGNPNAFVNTLQDKMDSLMEMAIKDMNMQCYLDGTGVRATISGAHVPTGIWRVDQIKYLRNTAHVNLVDGATGNTFRVGGDSDAGDGAPYAGARFTLIDINPANPAATSNMTVQFGSSVAGTGLIADNPDTATSGDFIVRHKTIGVELTGLDAIVDDGVYNTGANEIQGIERDQVPGWKGKVFSNAGTPRPLTLNLMQIAIDVPEVLSGRRIDTVIGSFNARDQYLKLLVPQKRFTDMKLDGGYQVLEYNGREFIVDVDCQDDRIYFLNRASIQKYGLFDMKFVDRGGGILHHESLSAGDVFYAFLRSICNLGTTQANANAKIVDLEVQSDYIVAG